MRRANLSSGAIEEFYLARGAHRITVTGNYSRVGCFVFEEWISGDFQRLCVFKSDTSIAFRLRGGRYRLVVSGANHVFVNIDRLFSS